MRRRFFHSVLWLIAGAIAASFGNESPQRWASALSPDGLFEQGIVELFGANFQWAVLLVLWPVALWANGRSVEWGLAIPVGLLFSGNGTEALIFLPAIVGVGFFVSLREEDWWAKALGGAGSLLWFGLLNPWAGLLGGGTILFAHAIKKHAALPALIVFMPSVVAAALRLGFFAPDGPSMVDLISALGLVCLTASVLAFGVGVLATIALVAGAAGAHPAAALADSVGVRVVDAPEAVTPDLLADGFVVQPGARFVLVEAETTTARVAPATNAVAVAEVDGWQLFDTHLINPGDLNAGR